MKIEMNKWPRLWPALGHTAGNNTKSQSKLCNIMLHHLSMLRVIIIQQNFLTSF